MDSTQFLTIVEILIDIKKSITVRLEEIRCCLIDIEEAVEKHKTE